MAFEDILYQKAYGVAHSVIRDILKPVITAVDGYAIGGGHVLHAVCDLTIAADTARFGQIGPKVGSVDPGFGTAYLARTVGEKKAREIWYLCEQYTAEECQELELVNKVVPAAVAVSAVGLYDGTDEALEGRAAFSEKRRPNFRQFRR